MKLEEGNVFTLVCLSVSHSVHRGILIWTLPIMQWTSLYRKPHSRHRTQMSRNHDPSLALAAPIGMGPYCTLLLLISGEAIIRDLFKLVHRMTPRWCWHLVAIEARTVGSIRAHLYQASVSTLRQHCDDTCDSVLIENSGVAWKWVANPIWSDSIVSMRTESQASLRFGAALTLTFGWNGPLLILQRCSLSLIKLIFFNHCDFHQKWINHKCARWVLKHRLYTNMSPSHISVVHVSNI